MQPLGPYSLSATNPQPFTIQWNEAQPTIGIEISNISGMLLQIQAAGQTSWLEPWTARYYPLAGSIESVLVEPGVVITPAANDPLKVTANVFQQGDLPPSQAVRQLTGMASQVAVNGSLGLAQDALLVAGTINVTSGDGSIGVNVPDGIQSLVINLQSQSPVGLTGTINIGTGRDPDSQQTFPCTSGQNFGAVLVCDALSGTLNTISVHTSPAFTDTFNIWVTGYSLPASMVRSRAIPINTGPVSNFEIPGMGLLDGSSNLTGIPSNPLRVTEDSTAIGHTTHVATVTTSSTNAALATGPNPANQVQEVVHMAIRPLFLATPTAATHFAFITGGSTGARYLQRIAQTGQLDLDAEWGGKMFISEGLFFTCTVPAGQQIQAVAVTRILPMP